MATNPFPLMTLKAYEPHQTDSGRYTPSVHLDEPLLHVLQDILDEACNIGGCENPAILADWLGVALDAHGQLTHQSTVLLYHDGGDWAEEEDGHYEGIGVLFYRRDTDATTSPPTVAHRVHIPNPEGQDRLLASCDALAGDHTNQIDTLNDLRDYLTSILNYQAAWKPLAQILGELALEEEGLEP